MLTIFDDLTGTAEWRAQKAVEYPDDERNVHAAEQLSELAQDDADPELVKRYEEIWSAADDGLVLVETQSEILKSIGFHTGFDSINGLLQELIDRCEEQLQN